MKLVHTSDWHLGAWLGAIDRRPDLVIALDALVDLVADVKPDLVIHTGDLFDRSLPAGDDVRFAADLLTRLAAIAPVLVLCGNHDGRPTFSGIDKFCSIGGGRLRLLAQIDVHSPILVWPTAGGGRVRVGAVPYQPLAAAGFPAIAEGTLTSGAYADRIRQLWALIGGAFDRDRLPGDVDIAAAHLHVAGAILAQSEKAVHVGDDAATDAAALPAVSYAAYGHIHKPQSLPGKAIGRYAGSPIPLDFGEAGEAKGAVVVDAPSGRAARIEPITLASGRSLVTVTGALADLPALLAGHPNSIIRVRITDSARIDHLANRVGELLGPAAVCHSVSQPGLQRRPSVRADGHENADVLTLLGEYVAAEHADPTIVEGLKSLWLAASDDINADLTSGALAALNAAVERKTALPLTTDSARQRSKAAVVGSRGPAPSTEAG